MGADTVDDLHYAEDLACRLLAAARWLVQSPQDPEAMRELAEASTEDYCRPSCQDGTCLDDCGCPGHPDGEPHRDDMDE